MDLTQMAESLKKGDEIELTIEADKILVDAKIGGKELKEVIDRDDLIVDGDSESGHIEKKPN